MQQRFRVALKNSRRRNRQDANGEVHPGAVAIHGTEGDSDSSSDLHDESLGHRHVDTGAAARPDSNATEANGAPSSPSSAAMHDEMSPNVQEPQNQEPRQQRQQERAENVAVTLVAEPVNEAVEAELRHIVEEQALRLEQLERRERERQSQPLEPLNVIAAERGTDSDGEHPKRCHFVYLVSAAVLIISSITLAAVGTTVGFAGNGSVASTPMIPSTMPTSTYPVTKRTRYRQNLETELSATFLNDTEMTVLMDLFASYTPEFATDTISRISTTCTLLDQGFSASSDLNASSKILTIDYRCDWSSIHVSPDQYAILYVARVNENIANVTADVHARFPYILKVNEVAEFEAFTPAPTSSPMPSPRPSNMPSASVPHSNMAPSSNMPSNKPSSSKVPSNMPPSTNALKKGARYLQKLETDLNASFLNDTEMTVLMDLFASYTPEFATDPIYLISTMCTSLDQGFSWSSDLNSPASKILTMDYRCDWSSVHVSPDQYPVLYVAWVNAHITNVTADVHAILPYVLEVNDVAEFEAFTPAPTSSFMPSPLPSNSPTTSRFPSLSPSDYPSPVPTREKFPTPSPTVTRMPTPFPTINPTPLPTVAVDDSPSVALIVGVVVAIGVAGYVGLWLFYRWAKQNRAARRRTA